jgi:hypothetical protein
VATQHLLFVIHSPLLFCGLIAYSDISFFLFYILGIPRLSVLRSISLLIFFTSCISKNATFNEPAQKRGRSRHVLLLGGGSDGRRKRAVAVIVMPLGVVRRCCFWNVLIGQFVGL